MNELKQAGNIIDEIQKEKDLEKRKEKYDTYLVERAKRIELNSKHQETIETINAIINQPLVTKNNINNEIIWTFNCFLFFLLTTSVYIFYFTGFSTNHFKPSLTRDFSIITSCLVIEITSYMVIVMFVLKIIIMSIKQWTISSIINDIKCKYSSKKTQKFQLLLMESCKLLSILIFILFSFFYLISIKDSVVCFTESNITSYCNNFKFLFNNQNNGKDRKELNVYSQYYFNFKDKFNEAFNAFKLNKNDIFIFDKQFFGKSFSNNNCYINSQKTSNIKLLNSTSLNSGRPVLELLYTDKLNSNNENNNTNNHKSKNSTVTWYQLETYYKISENYTLKGFSFHIPRLELFLNKLSYMQSIKHLTKNQNMILISILQNLINGNKLLLNHLNYYEYQNSIDSNTNKFSFLNSFLKLENYLNNIIAHNKVCTFLFKTNVKYFKINLMNYKFQQKYNQKIPENKFSFNKKVFVNVFMKTVSLNSFKKSKILNNRFNSVEKNNQLQLFSITSIIIAFVLIKLSLAFLIIN